MPKLFIADPALSSHQGHHYSVTEAFSLAAEQCGVEVVWLVNKNYKINSDDKATQHKIDLAFSHSTYDGYKTKKPTEKNKGNTNNLSVTMAFKEYLREKVPDNLRSMIGRVLRRIGVLTDKNNNNKKETQNVHVLRPEQEIYRALKRHDYRPEDGVLFHTCDAHTYRDIVSFFSKLATINEWNKFPRFFLSTPYDELVMPHNKTGVSSVQSIRYLNALGLIGTRIFLYAENELLRKHLTDLWQQNVSTLYVPQSPVTSNLPLIIKKNRLDVMYLGAARTEKGFVLIAEAIEKFLKRYDRQDVYFTIQSSPQIMGYTPDIQIAVEQLRAIKDDRLRLIETVQTPEEYRESIMKSDVLLLCYDKQRYTVRSSGIVVEALVNKKNIISTKGTFPSFLAAEAGLEIENVSDILNAINKIADDPDYYQSTATKRSKWLLKESSIEPFLNFINSDEANQLVPIETHLHIKNSTQAGQFKWMRLI